MGYIDCVHNIQMLVILPIAAYFSGYDSCMVLLLIQVMVFKMNTEWYPYTEISTYVC